MTYWIIFAVVAITMEAYTIYVAISLYHAGYDNGRDVGYADGLHDGAVTICVTHCDPRRVPVERLEPSRN